MSSPPAAKLLTARREFPDEVGERLVVGVAAGLRAQQLYGVVGYAVPLDPEVSGAGVEEVEARDVGWPDRIGEEGGEEGSAELVGGKGIRAAVHDDGGCLGHRVQQPLHVETYALRRRLVTLARLRCRGAGKVVKVGAFGLVQMERPSERVQYAFGDTAEVAALQAGVVLDADPGQLRDLSPAQSRHPTGPVGRQTGHPRGDLGSAGGQEVADLAAVVHALVRV